jgi:hypothetical protein
MQRQSPRRPAFPGSLIAFALALASHAAAKEIVIEVHAKFANDGRPVVGAEIKVAEMRRVIFNLFGLGRVHAEYVGRTDERGHHRMTIDRPRRYADIRLSPVECMHDGAVTLLTNDELNGHAEAVVELLVYEAPCDSPGE